MYSILAYAAKTNRDNFVEIHAQEDIKDVNPEVEAYSLLKHSQDSLDSCTGSVRQESDRDQIWATTTLLTQENLTIGQCVKGQPIDPFHLQLNYSFAYKYALLGSILLPDTGRENLYVSNAQWCALVNTVIDTSSTFDSADRNVFDRFMTTFITFRSPLALSIIVTAILMLIELYLPIPSVSVLREHHILLFSDSILGSAPKESNFTSTCALTSSLVLGHQLFQLAPPLLRNCLL